ncbi:response regulator transcription factor [Paenibacillus sedimenti]|uniref:Response regulator n=1 Tax=Paenibacillus sedimenti TaxID=2770274 RepID=A0A926KJE1_9BACL|nr:response regulator [Paenibacillus sedimenti]MBD0378690.1 response regulator [Paenibacillus sedimenti]
MLNGKVLIVEDQSNFRRGLVKMIESGGLGWTVAGEASNGQDALALLDQVKPDLVLTDIRMPIMDGIEFVGHLRQSYPDLLVIILTGYKNFEYAQAAVRHGALDLLIKPCTEQDVRQVLNKASECFYERYTQQQKEFVQQRLGQDQALRAFLLDLPHTSRFTPGLNELLSGSELWLLQCNHDDFVKPDYQKSDRSLLQFALSNIVEELMKSSGVDARLILVEHDRFVLVTEHNGVGESLREEIRSASLQFLKIRLKMILMGTAQSAEHLTQLYKNTDGIVKGAADNKLAGEKESMPGMLLSLNQAKVKEMEVQLMSAILMGQSIGLQQLLDQMLTELSGKPSDEMKIGALALSIALQKLMQKEFDPDGTEPLARIPGELPQSYWTSEEVIGWLSKQVKNFILLFNNWQASKSDNVIEKAAQYIEEHYHEACRLTDVAAHVHLNPSYFSASFKKATGESFTSYVTRFRIEKAALLLRNTDMKIFEIAGAVGFDEPNYFTNVFKQRYQMSPKEYRNCDKV